jgi:hypothetical protein
MAQQLRILQSLWAMERRRADAAEWPLQTQLAMSVCRCPHFL